MIRKSFLLLLVLIMLLGLNTETLGVTKPTILFNKFESYQFTNNSNRLYKLKTNGSKYDFAIYEKDGTSFREGIGVSLKELNIPIGGKLVVTSWNNNKKLVLSGITEQILVEKSTNKALRAVNLKKNENYTFINNDSTEHTMLFVRNKNCYFDYALYTKDGAVISSEIKFNKENIKVPANGRLVVTNISGVNLYIGGYYNFFDGNISEFPAVEKLEVTLSNWKNYEFKNISTKEEVIYVLNTKSTSFNYILFDENGKGQRLEIMKYYSSIKVPSGWRFLATSSSVNPVTFIAKKAFFTGQYIESVYTHTLLSFNQSYEFTNIDQSNYHSVFISGKPFDYAIYNKEGQLIEDNLDSKKAYINVPAGGRLIVSVSTKSKVYFAGRNNYFTGKKLD